MNIKISEKLIIYILSSCLIITSQTYDMHYIPNIKAHVFMLLKVLKKEEQAFYSTVTDVLIYVQKLCSLMIPISFLI